MPKSINPDLKRAPYYIVAPHYVRTSAGIRCLHLLCHWLNRMGERAFIALYHVGGAAATNPDLMTPLLTKDIIDHHLQLGVRPIVVYPEVVAGNPLDSECVVRWVLNFPGLLGGDASFPETELVFSFSKVLAEAVGAGTPVLHMPVLDEGVFNPGTPRPRSNVAFYAAKYQDVHGGEVFGVPEGAIEITRDRPDSQTPAQIAEILRSVERLYVFENTALATEAVLCGCPAVFMPNPWLEKPIALEELGWDGMAWGDDPAEIERARATIEQGRANYHRTIDEFFGQLDAFIARSQAKALEGRYERRIEVGFLSGGPLTLIQLIKRQNNWHLSEWARINRAVMSVLWRRHAKPRLRALRTLLLGETGGKKGAGPRKA